MMHGRAAGRAARLDLSHLTNLTALQVECARRQGSFVASTLVLPPQLQVASLRCCPSLQPLEGLMRLRVLTLENPPSDGLLLLKPLMTGELCGPWGSSIYAAATVGADRLMSQQNGLLWRSVVVTASRVPVV